MKGKLRLGPLPKTEMVRLTITFPAPVKADLDRYAELYAREYGEPVDALSLVPHMLATFMERDRAFRRSAQPSVLARSGASAASSDATSSTNDTDGETSPAR